MQFFFYCRDKAGAGEARRALLKDHWAFMDRYVDSMIARGPTMSSDGKAMTGSMHIVDLPDADAARVFAHEDPFAQGRCIRGHHGAPLSQCLGPQHVAVRR